jgi:hypothetical protein
LASTTIQNLTFSNFDFNDYFSFYPNPTNEILNIKNNKEVEITSLSIYNSLGQLILVATGNNSFIDVSSLKTGTYLLKIVSNNGTTCTKFIKD